jgi:hypothetical protein
MDESSGNRTETSDVAGALQTFSPANDEHLVDPDIARYESMNIEDVNAELHDHGIHAEETIKAVIALIDEHRRSVHLEKAFHVAVAVVLAVAAGIRRTAIASARPWEIGRAAPIRLLS